MTHTHKPRRAAIAILLALAFTLTGTTAATHPSTAPAAFCPRQPCRF